ncbi:glycosyltransferase [Vogesella sp. XCS3]|uniref:CgeB family protein n=1 Tax=Vogesella sp. XCS3 TaxID=2877939 RepID=UPI001D0AAA42|nr:glycosyltransferase [Vogesella sp. XCS3]UDM16702.1 glycosyltransferase [Vogesella sp. XCS3]
MKILLVCMEYDYGDPARGRSYEYFNFYDSLIAKHEVVLFDYMQNLKQHGKNEMNRLLVQQAREQAFDVAIFSPYTDQLDPAAVQDVRAYTRTLCFFHDDNWRQDFVRFWAPQFDYFTSSDYTCHVKYKKLGLSHVIHFPFGANDRLYKPVSTEKKYDVSFVGGWNPTREWLIDRLKKAGINVHVAGFGWPGGIVAHEDMVRIFSESRINLNLTNSRCWDIRMLASRPINGLRQLRSPKSIEQIKARHFEINACGSFQLSYYVEGIERAYQIGDEIAVYADPDDMVAKVHYYLEHADLRENIAKAGYDRTVNEHTFARRFDFVFSEMGLAADNGDIS